LIDFSWKHRGQRGFVLGAGPSINILNEQSFDWNLLDEEIVVGVKRTYRFCKLTYLVSIDTRFIETEYSHSEEFRRTACIKFIPKQYMASSDAETDPTYVCLPYFDKRHPNDELPTSFSEVDINSNSGCVAVRIAYALGLNPLYLIGLDGVTHNGKTHWHDDYENVVKGVGQHTIPILKFIRAAKKQGVIFYSCSPISKLNDEITYVSIKEVLNLS
jgi:hypothetical protein